MLISDLNSTLSSLLSQVRAEQIFLLTDAGAGATCLPSLNILLPNAPTLVLHTSEKAKSLQSIEDIWDFLLAHQATRDAILINLGGGVVTDMGGFAAATYKRGIRFINMPTTLLAMVDASTGGKTGFNYHGLKNIIGTFSQPLQTLIYPPFLTFLPAVEWISGYAEMLKHALIADYNEWNRLLRYNLHTRNIQALTPLLEASLHIKQHIVDIDQYEHGVRRALNFGHTAGHAIEATYAQQHRPVHHGYCVLWGMIAALYLSVVRLGFPRQPLQQLQQIMLEYYGRPACNCTQQDALLDLMRQDKKNTLSSDKVFVNFTLLRDIGKPVINQTPTDTEIREALDYLFSL